MIKKYLFSLFRFLGVHKKKCFIFILLFLVFVLIRFPYNEVVSLVLNRMGEKYSIHLKYRGFYINPLNFSLVFKEPEISTPFNSSVFTAKQMSMRLSYSSLLRLKPGAVLVLEWPDSYWNIIVNKKKIERGKTGWQIQMKGHKFNPIVLQSFSPLFSKITGKITFDIKTLIDPDFEKQPEGSWTLRGLGFRSEPLSYTFPGHIGSISLPTIKWSGLSSEGQIKEGQITISDLSFGEKKDPLSLKVRGLISIDFTKRRLIRKVRPRLKSYNLGLEVLAEEDMRAKSYFYFFPRATQTPQGWRAHIEGTADQFLRFDPVAQLPTLEELQNSQQGDIF